MDLLKYDPPAKVTSKHSTTTSAARKGASDSSSCDEIINTILPPKSFAQHGELWTQKVSLTPATTLDLVQLQEKLDSELRRNQARQSGICPIREKLYESFFDELIRQVTIQCTERGLVLVQIRDELRATSAAYQELYESSIAFGMRKALTSEKTRAELEARHAIIDSEVADIEATVAALEARAADVERAESAGGSAEARREDADHMAEINNLKASIDGMKEALEAALAPPPVAINTLAKA